MGEKEKEKEERGDLHRIEDREEGKARRGVRSRDEW